MYRFVSLLLLVGMAQEIYSGESFFLEIAAKWRTQLLIQKTNPSKQELADIITGLNTTLENLYKELGTSSAFQIHVIYDRGSTETGKSTYYNSTILPNNRTKEQIKSFNECVQKIIENLSR